MNFIFYIILFLLKAKNFTHFVISINSWYTYDMCTIIKEYINGYKMYRNIKCDYKHNTDLIIKIYIAIEINIYTFIHSKLIFIMKYWIEFLNWIIQIIRVLLLKCFKWIINGLKWGSDLTHAYVGNGEKE